MTLETAILAGGCFWGVEELIRQLNGVHATRVGYTGGTLVNPTYDDICTGRTGHTEAIEVIFDSQLLSFEHLLQFFFQIHDPTTPNRQGNDRGTQYRSAIFYMSDTQRHAALQLIEYMNESNKWPAAIVTEVVPANIFYEAERYHQRYLEFRPHGYNCHFIRPQWRL